MRKGIGFFVLLAVALSASASAAGPEKLIYDLALGTTNPCNGSLASAPGTVKITVQARNDGTWDVKFGFRGDGTDDVGGAYRAVVDGAQTFGVLEPQLSFGFAGSFIGKQGTPTFNLSGQIDVLVDGNGVPYDAFIGADTFACVGH